MKSMKRPIVALLSLLILSQSITGQGKLIQNPYARRVTLLDGYWNYIIDPYEVGFYGYRNLPYDQTDNPGNRDAFYNDSKALDKSDRIEYGFDLSDSLRVPGDWNTQKKELLYYEGTIWYRKIFDDARSDPDHRLFLYFGAVNYRADVYLNGVKLGIHKGGFTPFNFEITSLIRARNNSLVVKVDNRRRAEEVPALNTDWWNYGGITRDVLLLETPATFLSDYLLKLNPINKNQLVGYLQLDGIQKAGERILIEIPEIKIKQTIVAGQDGYATVQIKVKDLKLWTPEIPCLYTILFSTADEKIMDRIGFRFIETQGQDILLNGWPVFLRGICIHEEKPLEGGRANSPEDAQILLNWAKDLGCNYVRLAHYPHNEFMVKMADEMGIMVWEEIPVYWTIQWNNPETFRNASNQLKEVMARDKNRASVIIWSMANETPAIPERWNFLKNLADTARTYDNSRLISAALEQHNIEGNDLVRIIDDPFSQHLDILSFNEYVGWYDGLPDKCSRIQWVIKENKPVIISEFGADALQGLHGDSLTRWTEEYQEYTYKENLRMIERIPQIRGMSPWILMDFRSPRRVLPGIQDGWNRKGLVSLSGQKKKAYFVLQQFYRQKKEQP
jgi:beta-glucuronidase